MEKFVFITPYLKWHGTGYFDVILQGIDDAYSEKELIDESLCKERDAYDMYDKFYGDQGGAGKLNHLEKTIYLLPGDYFDDPDTHSKWKEFLSEQKQSTIKTSITEKSTSSGQSLSDLEKLNGYLKEYKRFPNYIWLKDNWKNRKDIWHVINDFTIKTQVDWYKENSAIYKKHSEQILFVTLNATYQQFESEEFETVNAINDWLMKHPIGNNTYINLWGTQTTCQVAFHYLAWSLPRLNKARLIKCKSVRNQDKRIPNVKIEITRKNLLSDLVTHESSNTLSPSQKDAVKWLHKYKEWGDFFTILLLGPRGCGKTKSVNEIYGKEGIEVVNCAQFQSNPELARSELFGHKKGSFTGASDDSKGAFERAKGKVLFLDEIHHLDNATQTMLLTALQTDENGDFSYRPLGGSKIEKTQFQLIVASNLKHDELRERMPLDLLDRISQRILEFKSISSGASVEDKFNNIWNEMNFKGRIKPVNPLP
ncbi:sigma 54-interacting transcriptional regulator, partial [Photobacterium japonica]|uniref:sigma 54-interacting transcriptional regulator n=1 Tax=Photobacterium japonica TaxID=2910235 RepID=UPI003D0F2FA5